jgi:hypothetical protein
MSVQYLKCHGSAAGHEFEFHPGQFFKINGRPPAIIETLLRGDPEFFERLSGPPAPGVPVHEITADDPRWTAGPRVEPAREKPITLTVLCRRLGLDESDVKVLMGEPAKFPRSRATRDVPRPDGLVDSAQLWYWSDVERWLSDIAPIVATALRSGA